MSVHAVNQVITDTLDPQFSKETKADILTALTTTDGLLFGAKARLFTAPAEPNGLNVAADFIAPIWTGYADTSITWNPVAGSGVYGATVEANSVDWQSASDADENIAGIVFLNADSDVVISYQRFGLPLPIVGVQSETFVWTLTIN